MCGYREQHGGHDCCAPVSCGCGDHFHRRFATREERIARLDEYLQELRTEVGAVEERLAELKTAQ